ncbi:hypothetical protein [Streptomyces sp. NPDC086023]
MTVVPVPVPTPAPIPAPAFDVPRELLVGTPAEPAVIVEARRAER